MITDGRSAGLKLDDYLPYRLSVASNGVSGLIARAYQDRFGLTVPQWRLICVLADGGALTPAQIEARTMMDPETVSHAAQDLTRRELATRTGRRGHDRSHLLSLSETGREIYREVAPLALAYEAALISGLKPEEVMLLKRLLYRLQTAAETLAGEAEPLCRLAG